VLLTHDGSSLGPVASSRIRADKKSAVAAARLSADLELSERFDGITGFERSVADLACSYAVSRSAVRARMGPSNGCPEAVVSGADQGAQIDCVADGVPVPVVVEIGEHVLSGAVPFT